MTTQAAARLAAAEEAVARLAAARQPTPEEQAAHAELRAAQAAYDAEAQAAMTFTKAAESLLDAVQALSDHDPSSEACEKACAAYEALTGFVVGDVRDPRSYTSAEAWAEAVLRDWCEADQGFEAEALLGAGYEAVAARPWAF